MVCSPVATHSKFLTRFQTSANIQSACHTEKQTRPKKVGTAAKHPLMKLISMQSNQQTKHFFGIFSAEKYIAVLFLVSGFSALIYQVVWQRVLFTTFGTNSEAVTVIVSVFMFGLGMGALAGGRLQKMAPRHLLQLFLILEVSIGVFGFFSLELIQYIGQISGTATTAELVLWSYVILAFPTLCMGATLPILVAYLQKHFDNMGKSIGLLYAFNTIGSAIAAFCTVQILFVYTGQAGSIFIAAICNLVTALLIFDASRQLKVPEARLEDCVTIALPERSFAEEAQPELPRLSYWVTFFGLAFIGYIALSQEIIWYRLLGFLTGGRPQVFGLLLTAFLVGIAGGSLWSKKICERGHDPYAYLVKALFLSAVIFYLSVPTVAYVTANYGKEIGSLVAYLLIALVSFFTGGILPMLIHIGVDQKGGDGKAATQAMSWLYFANILGATLGPLLTGFILLDFVSMEGNVLILTGLALSLLLALLRVLPKYGDYKVVALIFLVSSMVVGQFWHEPLYQGYLGVFQYGSRGHPPFKHVLENRASIITVADARGSDIIYGGGIYDGRFNIDPVDNSNWIDRAFMVAALHRRPQKMLEIGLSSGSWTKVLASYHPLEKLTVVEINKDYPEIIRKYPQIYAALSDPKVQLVFDDGRRWLRNHPQEKFDFIVMNTTYYWRNNSTNLLSREFLEMCKGHLNPGGVIYYNTTGLRDIVFTAANVFNHVTMYRNFVAASDAAFDMTAEESRRNLLLFHEEDGASTLQKGKKHVEVLDRLSTFSLKDQRDSVLTEPNLRLITDDNMLPEYKVAMEAK